MVTVVNNQDPRPLERNTIIDRPGDGSAGWAVAVIVLIAVVVVGMYIWYHRAPAYSGTTTPNSAGASLNITLPSGASSGQNSSSGSSAPASYGSSAAGSAGGNVGASSATTPGTTR